MQSFTCFSAPSPGPLLLGPAVLRLHLRGLGHSALYLRHVECRAPTLPQPGPGLRGQVHQDSQDQPEDGSTKVGQPRLQSAVQVRGMGRRGCGQGQVEEEGVINLIVVAQYIYVVNIVIMVCR